MVEIGPGRGVLTRPLAGRVAALHAIEIDRDLAAARRAEFAGDDTVTIHRADALDFDYATLGSGLRLAGNLPYNISTPLLFRLLEQRAAAGDAFADMHFMLQKEVVERMAAAPGGKTYGRLTVMLACHLEVTPLFDVPPAAFAPPPKVVSTVVRLKPRETAWAPADEARFAAVVAAAFSQRRKTLRNALAGLVDESAIRAAGVDPGARAETLDPAAFARISGTLAE